MNEKEFKIKERIFEMLYDATRDKFGILPIISGLVIALLGLLAAGGLLTPTDNLRYIATALLLLMVLSLQMYQGENGSLIELAHKRLAELNGKKLEKISLNLIESLVYIFSGKVDGQLKERSFFERFSSQFPNWALLIIWWIVFLIIVEIW